MTSLSPDDLRCSSTVAATGMQLGMSKTSLLAHSIQPFGSNKVICVDMTKVAFAYFRNADQMPS